MKKMVMYATNTKKLLIMGAGGHGKVIKDLAWQIGYYEEISFLADHSFVQEKNDDVIGDRSFAITHKEEYDVIVAVGNAKVRKQIQEEYEKAGVNLVSLIHPFSYVAEDAFIDRGSVIMAGAVVQPGTHVGRGSIVNTGASIDHENEIGDFVHIAVGTHLAGNVKVEDETWIGAGAVVSNNIFICSEVMVGAGAVVVKDITESGTYVGVPARKIN